MTTLSLSHTDKINYLNIGLIILSAGLAYWIPFQLFLFAYAILGPLHYLTEISWLHKSNYFVTGKKDYLILVALGIISYLANFVLRDTEYYIFGLGTATIFMAFVGAFCFLAFDETWKKLIGIAIASVVSYLFTTTWSDSFESYFIAIGVFIPTIIHVCVFTWFFMIYGSIKSKSKTGFLAALLFLLTCIFIFIYQPDISYKISNYVARLYFDTFSIVNRTLMHVFSYSDITMSEPLTKQRFVEIFFSQKGQMFTRFVAFIYLYHYLNWFSKTSIIKWHEVSKDKLIIILALWILSVGLYIVDYKLGFQVLFTLSMMHVFLEFPLNFRSIQTIIQKLIGK